MLWIAFLVLLILKVAGVVAMSWWVVFAPLLLIVVLFGVAVVSSFFAVLIADKIVNPRKKSRRYLF